MIGWLLTLLATLFVSALVSEILGWTQPLAEFFIRKLTARMPTDLRERMEEEWLGEVERLAQSGRSFSLMTWVLGLAVTNQATTRNMYLLEKSPEQETNKGIKERTKFNISVPRDTTFQDRQFLADEYEALMSVHDTAKFGSLFIRDLEESFKSTITQELEVFNRTLRHSSNQQVQIQRELLRPLEELTPSLFDFEELAREIQSLEPGKITSTEPD